MSIKYRTGQGTSASNFTDLVVKVGDTLPIGAIIGFDTTGTIPNGWEYYAENQIKKISPTTPANGNIENQYGTSQTNAYSEAYANTTFATKDVATTSANGLMSSSDKTKLNGLDHITYSATETDTGDIWVNNLKIYRITFNGWQIPAGNEVTQSLPGASRIISVKGILLHTGTSRIYPFPYSNTDYWYFDYANKVIHFITSGKSGWYGSATIEYTK